MTADRTDPESDDDDDAEPSASTDDEADSPTIPSVATENAGSGLWSDLKSDSTDEAIDMPGVSDDVNAGGASNEPEVDLSEVPNDLIETFVAVVVALNAAILGLSLGTLFLVFEGASIRSVALLVGGVFLFGFAVRRYRQYRDSGDESDESDGSDENTGSDTDESNESNESDASNESDKNDEGGDEAHRDDLEPDDSETRTDSS